MERLKRIGISVSIIFIGIFLMQLIPMNEVIASAAAKVSISHEKAYLLPGETLQLKLTGTTKKVTWSSGSKDIATVSKNGLVTAKEAGRIYINAKVDNKTYKCYLVVIDISGISIYYDTSLMTTNGSPIRVYATSFDYYDELNDIEIKYKILGGHQGEVEKTNNYTCNVKSYETGTFEVEASLHGKVIEIVELESVLFTALDTYQLSLEAGEVGSVYVDPYYYYPKLEDIKVTSSDSSVAVAKAENFANYDSYLGSFCIKGLKAGTTTIAIEIAGITKTVTVNVTGEVQQPLYDPVQAVKLGKFDGYTGNELATLLYVYDFIHDYNLDSPKMKDKEKIDYVQTLFYYLYQTKSYRYYWTSYGDISRVLLLRKGIDMSTSCAKTISFLMDCLDIPSYYCTGTLNGQSWAWNQVEVDGTWIYLDAAGYMKYERPDFTRKKLWEGYTQQSKVKYSEQKDTGEDYYSLIG